MISPKFPIERIIFIMCSDYLLKHLHWIFNKFEISFITNGHFSREITRWLGKENTPLEYSPMMNTKMHKITNTNIYLKKKQEIQK